MNNKWIYRSALIVLAICASCEQETRSDYPQYVDGSGVFDVEGNEYKTVIIGDQEWMAENLKTDLYCSGDSIPYLGDAVHVKVYDNDPENEAIFGKLYNFQAVIDSAGLCPCGWHIPSELEYAILIDYLGGLNKAMRRMKSRGSIDKYNGLWIETNPSGNNYPGTNSSGFNALPAGMAGAVKFYEKDTAAFFWATPVESTDAIMYRIGDSPNVQKQNFGIPYSKYGIFHSIRCIKDL